MRIHTARAHKSEATNIVFRANIAVNSRVIIGDGILADVERTLAQLELGSKLCVLSQPSIEKSIVEPMAKALSGSRFETRFISLPDGEQCKSHENLLRVWTELQEMKFQRSDCIIAIGGGALTDLAGFAASTYLRGIKLILVPTTLLAQVDAAIGGKTGINLPAGKNLAGSFYFPTAVFVDLDALSTLPERELRSGIGEIIKYALIEDTVAKNAEYRRGPRGLFSVLNDMFDADIDPETLTGIVTACIKMKLAVVAKDPHEQRLRRSLNLGHTLGHAVEKVSQYKYTHGEAVAIGLVFASRVSEQLNKIEASATESVKQLLSKAGLPTAIPDDLSRDDLLKAMKFDKKSEGDEIRWVLPEQQLGSVDLDTKVSLDQVRQLL
jgi:3-dehydroquinate synthase